MMMNLFSMFDPSIPKFSFFNWLILLLITIFLFMFKLNSKKSLVSILYNFIKKELNTLILSKKLSLMINFLILFMSIYLLNFFSLFPFVFSLTAHMSVSFFLSLLIWFSFMIFLTTKNFKNMMIHLMPLGTPYALMNFMVLIELVSSLIRPITLSIRLSANMVAGHLLLSLLSGFCSSSFMNFTFFSIMFPLSLLELAVCVIQGYVFMTLLILYSNEIN